MRTEPTDLDRAVLAAALRTGWGLRDAVLADVPEGSGSHHWHCRAAGGEERWVSVDDLRATFHAAENEDDAFAALERAFATAAALREAGLRFVVAPLRDGDGRVLRRLGRRYAVRVAPVVAGAPGEFGVYSADDRRRVGALVGRLHAATDRVPAGLARTADLAIPSHASLITAIGEIGRGWDSGPPGRGRARAPAPAGA